MSLIRKLLPHEIQQIAAGEVVERPASIVKELVENSIDAQSTHIDICVENGGKDKIYISDNGKGMTHDDAILSLEAHTTSKLKSIDSLLNGLDSKGFRGEALSSITSVARIELKTKTKFCEYGVQILAIPEKFEQNIEECVCETGTHIIISDLFSSVPARRKFLKSKETEWNAILTIVQHISLAYPHISFTLKHNDKTIYDASTCSSLYERSLQIVPQYACQHMIECIYDDGYIKVNGAISNYEFGTYDRSWILLHINQRNIKQHKLSQAVVRGYQDGLQPRKYPCVLLSIELNQEHVDVNVHPRKEEVAFIHPKKVENGITNAIKHTLEQYRQSLITNTKNLEKPTFSQAYNPQIIPAINNEYEKIIVQEPKSLHTSQSTNNAQLEPQTQSVKSQIQSTFSEEPRKEILKSKLHIQNIIPTIQSTKIEVEEQRQTYLGTYAQTYLMFERSQGLLLIDQHALHERIIYERLKKQSTSVEIQTLLAPFVYNTDDKTVSLVEKHYDILKNSGIDLSPINSTTLALRGILPILQKKVDLKNIVENIIKTLQSSSSTNITDTLLHDIRAMVACRSAIKAGDHITKEQINELINEADKYETTSLCPHGRPTSALITQYDIEKLFKRKV